MAIKLPRDIFSYPILIIQDRYGGVYSHGRWVAISQAFEESPEESESHLSILTNEGFGDDITASNFWHDVSCIDWIAVGKTPDEALRALTEKQNKVWEALDE
jgi:hypothetical protein